MMIEPTPEILIWARETARLSVVEAASKAGIRGIRDVSAPERLAAFESGEERPTMVMLESLAKTYRRPLVTFFLAAPPVQGDRGTDFRHVPAEMIDESQDALLDTLVRTIRARQSLLHDVLADEESEALGFIDSRTADDGVDALVDDLRAHLGVDLDEFRGAQTPTAAFALLRSAAEALGVFVLLASDLGSHHSAITVGTFRGLSIADRVAPLIVINDLDARAAWSFTLLHELTHLWLGQTGFGGTDVDSQIEQFCSDVASEFLLANEELADAPVPNGDDELRDFITHYASVRNLSRSMVAYRLYRVGRLDLLDWRTMADQFLSEWEGSRENERQRRRASGTGPSYYVIRRHRLGNHMLNVVGRALADRSLTSTEAGRVLGVDPKKVGRLLEEVH
ncbi:MAG: XRE family transcriptional regulator [Actinomycetota bacterium]|nr:XRE family transcriptional regulator [Actinomycetota bacterium]MDK1017775.1 XRE family transcriptional regulator [Actinomycetota bacterium]MDK1027196.1 XRE family transcriptional regulator [Actinomycetota bacterium]MDK1039397.1 XRE family transcriptional regulator [Actinomycetota bacterium]MDK1097637.1 XRE family transcriptional regulator [Actinomycetota bacterium]